MKVSRLPRAALAAALFAGGACATEGADPGGPGPVDDEHAAINAYLQDLDPLPSEEPSTLEGPPSAPAREGEYSCSTRDVMETGRFDEIVAYAANSDSLWPGAIVAGDSVYEGLFRQVAFERAPLTISVSLSNLVGAKSIEMTSPSLSASREALGELLAQEIDGATPANIYAEIEKVHSEEQLTLALGASASWLGAAGSVSASFDWDDQDVRGRYLVRYTQSYYTVDVDQPGEPADFLADGVTLDEVQAKAGPGNPPLYVSSITYGRLVVFAIESEYSSQELGAALEFAYHGGADVTGETSVTYRDIVSRSRITAYILGGAGGEAARAIAGYDELIAFIQGGGDYSKESPGAPIAYKLAHLADNSPARLSFTQDYVVRDCVRVAQRVRVTLNNLRVLEAGGDGNNDLEIAGQIAVTGVDPASPVWLYDKDDTSYVTVAEGATWPADGSSIAQGSVEVTPQPGGTIDLSVGLYEVDVFANDDLGYEVLPLRFEEGWRRDVNVLMTGNGAQVQVSLTLQPI